MTVEVSELGAETAKSGVVFLAGKLGGGIATLLTLVFLARFLQPAQFGIYVIAVAFYTLVGIGGVFGIGTALRKKLPELGNSERSCRLISSGIAITTLIASVLAVLAFLFSGVIATNVYHNQSVAMPLAIAAIVIFLTVPYNLILAISVGSGLVKEGAIGNISYAGSQLLFIVALVLLGYGVSGALIGTALSLVVGTVVQLFYLYARRIRLLAMPTRKAITELTAFSIPMVVSHVATLGAVNFAVLLLGVFATTTVVGNYGAAAKLGNLVTLILASNTFVLLPAFSKVLSKGELAAKMGAAYNRSIHYTLLFLLPLLAYLVSVSTPLLGIFFSRAYSLAPFYFSVIVIGTVIGIIGNYGGTLLIGYGDTKKFMKYQVLAVVIQVVLLLALTPYLKVDGVLLALFVLSPVFLDLIYIHALEEQFRFKHTFRKPVLVALVSVLIGALMFGVTVFLHQSGYAIIIDAVLALLLFPPLLAASKGIDRGDIKFIERVGSRLKMLTPLIRAIVGYAERFSRE